MKGDFFDLLPPNAFGRLSQSTAEQGARLEATTVFAFHCKAGALIAGDHRATAGNVIFTDQAEKIIPLDAHSVLAIAGSPAVAFEMARSLKTAFEFYRRSQLQPMSLSAKIRAISRLLRENLPATLQGFGAVAPIFAGFDSRSKESRPSIFYYDPMGADFKAAKFAASGSGSLCIKSILHYLEHWGDPAPENLELEAAINLANRLLMTAAEYDSATGGVRPERGIFGTLKLLSPDGVQPISEADQKAAWEADAS